MGRHLGNFSQSQKYLSLYFFSLYKPIRREYEIKFSVTFSSHSRFSSPSPFSSSSSYSLLKFSAATHVPLLLRCVFLSFYTCFSCLLWMIIDESCSNLEKYFIVMNLCLIEMEYQGFATVY